MQYMIGASAAAAAPIERREQANTEWALWAH